MIVQGAALRLPQLIPSGVDSQPWLSQEYMDTNFWCLPAALRMKLLENGKDQSLGQLAQR